MTERLEELKKNQACRNLLKHMPSIKMIGIAESRLYDNFLNDSFEDALSISKISCHTNINEIIIWLHNSLELKTGKEYIFFDENNHKFVQIEILDIVLGMEQLFLHNLIRNRIDGTAKMVGHTYGFCLLDCTNKLLIDVCCDSSDEYNYQIYLSYFQ
ncbi:hypothetical protein [Anaerocolumna sp.]|uniref:hypothetical protein n=1 Tax=Anaerocolumna sp. TaxID=2041569 RepID=UPI0028B21104|nr:hypothetical protein [Anaerocolumna sp.]